MSVVGWNLLQNSVVSISAPDLDFCGVLFGEFWSGQLLTSEADIHTSVQDVRKVTAIVRMVSGAEGPSIFSCLSN